MNVDSNKSGDLSQQSEYTQEEMPAGTAEALTTYLEGRKGWVSFEDISENVAQLNGAQDGVIHQVCFDCGYTSVSAV